MKMRYIIFTAVLMCLLSVEGKGQNFTILGLKTDDEISVIDNYIYGEPLSNYCKISLSGNKQWEGKFYISLNNVEVASLPINTTTNGTREYSFDYEIVENVVQGSITTITFAFEGWIGSNEFSRDVCYGSLSLKMVPRPVKITLNPTANCTKTYDGTTDAPSGFTDDLNLVYANDVTKVGILEADKNDAIITYSAQYDSKDVKGTNGSKIIVTGGLSGSKAGNYQLVFENADNKIEFPGTITQKSKIITLQKYYDGNKNFSTDNLVDKEFDGVNNEKIVISSIADAEIDAQDANVTADRSLKSGYAITYSNDVHKNYDISFFASILSKPLTISLTGPFTYGASKFGDDIVPTITDNIAGTFKAKNQSTNQEYTFENTPMLPAGTYTLSFDVSNNPGNYNVENNNSSFKVNPIELDVNLAFQKTYDKNTSVGDDDWSPKTLTNADNTNILSGDVVKIYFDNSKIFFASENVHTATTVSIPSDIDFKFLNENNTSLNGNYVLKNLTATSTIIARELTYTGFYFEKYYDGNSIASGYCITPQNQLTISQVSAIVGEDVVGFEFTNPAFESANATPSSTPYYTVSFENLTSTNPNYVFKNCAATGKILKRELEISLVKNNVTYGESKFVSDIQPTVNLKVATPAVTIPGNFVATNKTTNVTYSYDTNDDVMLPAGEYEISYELLADDKVNFTEPETKQVTVTKRETSINLSYTKDKIYDATTTVLDFNGVINNLIDADKTSIQVYAEYEDKNVGDNRIDFTISALELFKQNYACENAKIYNSNNVEIGHLDANCSFQFNNAADCIGKISQCEITINSTQNITKPYDGTTDVENFTVTGFSVAGNDNSVTFSPTTDYSLPEIEGKIYANEKIRITPTAEYNSKNVSEANKITISGTVDNDNYKVVTRQIEPATITPSVVTVTQNKKPTKTYDGDNSVKSFSDCYEVNGIFKNAQGYDEVQFLYNDASIKYTSVNAGTNIALDFSDANIRLEPVDNNYTLSVGEFKGDIKKIKPTIKWYIGDQEQTDPVRMSYGKLVGPNGDLYAMIYEATYREQYLSENCLYEVTSGYASGQNTENELLFTPGKGRAKVTFRPTDAVNYETVSSEINLEITFAWQFEHEVNSNYGSSIGNEIKFYYSGIGLSESDLEYTYFLDGKEVPKGYIPKVGPHKLYCKVKHATLGNTQTEEINFTIEPRVLILSKYDWVEDEGNKLRRPYDGTTTVYDEQIKELAKIDKDLIISGDEVFFNTDMAYDDEEVGDRVVNVKYSLTGKDSYCYVFDINKMQEYSEAIPGFIKRCPAFVGFKEYDKVYGSSELGKDIVPTTTYVRYKGEKISPEGTCVFEVLHDGNELREYESGKMMNVGVYYMRVKFTPEDQLHYEDGRSNFEYVKVTQKSISATGVTIEDKYYDGTAKVNPVKVKLFDPELDGVIEQDKNNVKLEITNLQDIKYPDVKIGDYQGLVVKVALKGSGIENYKLTNSELKANSSILPFEFHYNVEPDETGVYQFVYGSSVMGKDFKLINELTETQTVRYKISNIDKTNQMLVPNTYKVDVQLYDSDMLVQSQQVMVNVVKLKLLTTVPNIAHAKLHDGTVSVKLTGERCVLTNVVEGDQVEIEKQEQFYDSPDLGTGKTITVSFTLSGAWHSKYIEPDNYVYNDGVITNKNIQIGSVGISGDICPSSNAPIVFDVVEGIPDKASIKFSAEALENGFEDITITNTQFGLNSVELKIPEKAKAGEYTATLYLSSGSDNNFEKVFMFTVNYDASYIISKFSDVVAINNAGYDFVGYQWYKDGHVIETETKQFFNDLPCLYGWYSAKVLTVDGTYANICPRYFDKRTAVSKRANAGVNVYPNPALPMQAVTVELEDFEDYENCTIFIYNLSGVLITKIQNPDRLNTLNLPQGSYTGVVVKDDSRLTFKLIVRK